ncbi:MAG: type II toxin-antitoxin system VapC family toxin [Pseudomonadota bacterium]
MYILDTNTLVYFFKGVGNVSKHMLTVPPKDIGIPTIVLFELELGIAKSTSPEKRQTQLKNLTAVVNILPFGYDEVKCAASIRINLERKGMPIGPYDILIAGVAMANKGILVTHNAKEFGRIKGIQVEDWYEAN